MYPPGDFLGRTKLETFLLIASGVSCRPRISDDTWDTVRVTGKGWVLF